MDIHTQGQERPELPPPEYDPARVPVSPTRTPRDTYCLKYALRLAILLFSTSFEISVIITHFMCNLTRVFRLPEMLSDRCRSHEFDMFE